MPRRTILDGMDLPTLQARLTAMQTAYLDISSGAKAESLSYTQGEGSKSVSYTRADLPKLEQSIQLVQRQIDILTGVCTRNGPLKPYF